MTEWSFSKLNSCGKAMAKPFLNDKNKFRRDNSSNTSSCVNNICSVVAIFLK